MAIIMNTENSDECSSPRISFSNDVPEENSLEKQEEVMRLDKSVLLESNSEFNFCATSYPGGKESYYCPADELFYNGMIIPTQMKEKLNSVSGHYSKDVNKEEEEITGLTRATLIREDKSESKSVWRFKRSSSLNCENYIGRKKSSIWSLPLLFRSKSTGYCSSVVNKSSEDDESSKHSQKNTKFSGNNPSTRLHQKPPLKKSSDSKGASVRNSHVLNVPSPYIAKGTSDLLGLTSLFGYGSMEKKMTKK